MLTQNDLQSIQQVTKKVVDDAFDEFAVKTLNPAFQAVQDQINGVEDRVKGVEGKINGVQGQMNGLIAEIQKRPTLEQFNLKLDNMERRLKEDLGDRPLARDRVLNVKTDTVAGKLHGKSVFTREDVHEIEKISPFAVSPLG